MLEWIVRGLRRRIVTTRYPRAAEPAPDGFRGRVEVLRRRWRLEPGSRRVCPTGAIARRAAAASRSTEDAASSAGCASQPSRNGSHSRRSTRPPPAPPRRSSSASRLRPPSSRGARGAGAALKRSIHIRHVDAGSDGSEEWEIQALTNPYYDMQRLGLFFTLSPRHADILLVTGGVTEPMRQPLLRAWEAMPEPKAVVAAGTDACSGGFAAAAEERRRRRRPVAARRRLRSRLAAEPDRAPPRPAAGGRDPDRGGRPRERPLRGRHAGPRSRGRAAAAQRPARHGRRRGRLARRSPPLGSAAPRTGRVRAWGSAPGSASGRRHSSPTGSAGCSSRSSG